MSTPSIEVLNENIRKVQRRRKWIFALREICFGFAALGSLFLILGLIEMHVVFGLKGRTVLFCTLLMGAGILFWRYVRMFRQFYVDELQLAHYVEEHIPDLQQRLVTSIEYRKKEKQGVSLQLLGKLWEDAHAQIQTRKIEKVASTRSLWPAAFAVILISIAGLMGFQRLPDFGRAGLEILWPWSQPASSNTLSSMLTVKPGNIRIRRGEDVLISAVVRETASKRIHLYLQPEGDGWRKIQMANAGDGEAYQHFLSSIQKDLAYYVDTGRRRSEEYRISVYDPLRVERIDATYHYPEYTGLATKIEENAGDVTAPKGTRMTLRIVFNKPPARATLKFQEGDTVTLRPEGTIATGEFIVRTDTSYFIDAMDRTQEENTNPFEYFVQAIPDKPPEINLLLPGKDQRVMPLEEVPIAAVAWDDYGLRKFVLNYQVAGGKAHEVSLLKDTHPPRNKTNTALEGQALIFLEDLAVSPGDFVTFHLSAVDNNTVDIPAEVFSDIYFLQVVPTDEEFRKAPPQNAGGGIGMGGGMQPQQASALVENQKNVIAATWKLLQRQKKKPEEPLEKEIEIVAESQQKVLHRTQMSLRRLTERFSFSDESYDRAVTALTNAVTHMEAATQKLYDQQLEDALAPETSALKAILKAESESRVTQILVSRMRGGAGSGGQNLQEREDLRDLFKMEMGRLENRYELPPQAAIRKQQVEQEDIFKKLKELARRQEHLNRTQRELAQRQDQMTEEQKQRRLEQLRREQEMLRRQSEALSRRMSRLSRNADDQQWRKHRRQLDQATRQMKEATKSLRRQNLDMAAAKGRKALKNLRLQEKAIDGISKKPRDRHRGSGESTEDLMTGAMADAEDMRRELEMLQQQIDALRQSNRERETALSGEKGQPPQESGGAPGGNRLNIGPMQERFQRARRYAEGMLRPWAQGESWHVNARSIHRELTEREIEDFLRQPDLWKQLLEDVRELESALRAQVDGIKYKKNLFMSQDEELPSDYRQLIEEYYRDLSTVSRSGFKTPSKAQ